MVSQEVVIKNATGLHLRPAGLFSKTACEFECRIMIEKKNKGNDVSANAKSVLSLLGASVKNGDAIVITCDGADEVEALTEMVRIVEDGLGE